MPKEYGLEELQRDLVPVAKRIPAYTKLVAKLAKDPRISTANKSKLAAGLGYMVSPIDLIPGIIPVLGQLDDILAVLIALNSAVSSSPKEVVEPYLDEAGLDFEIIESDIALIKHVIKEASISLAKKTGRGLLKVGRYIGRRIAESTKDDSQDQTKTTGHD